MAAKIYETIKRYSIRAKDAAKVVYIGLPKITERKELMRKCAKYRVTKNLPQRECVCYAYAKKKWCVPKCVKSIRYAIKKSIYKKGV